MTKHKTIKYCQTKNLTRVQWLQARKAGIGGSDAASIVGLNKYSSPLAVYMDKTEPLNEVKDDQISEAAEWGTRLEGLIRQKFKENHPELKVQQSHFMWQHPVHKFMLANVDGLIFHPQKGWGVHEIKTASEYLKDDWGDEQAPEAYVIQIQHYLAVLGLDFGIFSVLIGGNKYREFYIERDEELIESLIQIEKDFWFNHVKANNPPEPDGSESAGEILSKLYPASTALPDTEVKELQDEAIELINELDEIKLQEKEMKKRKAEIEQKLQNMLGDYQLGMVEDRKVTWKPSRAFNEQVLKEKQPELYKEFEIISLDKARFKKSYPKVYEEYMLQTEKKSFSVKEDGLCYVC